MHHESLPAYIAARMIFILLLLEVIYFILASALVPIYLPELWAALMVSLPVALVASTAIAVTALHARKHTKLAARYTLRLCSLNTLLVIMIFFSALLLAPW